tara:strand:- start:764 stop:898 length:135 start_codon:yes stop_codon:yes gene_type:complete
MAMNATILNIQIINYGESVLWGQTMFGPLHPMLPPKQQTGVGTA